MNIISASKIERMRVVALRKEKDDKGTPAWRLKVRRVRAHRYIERQNKRLGRIHNAR